MKKYILFAGVVDYPSGGFFDFEGSTGTVDEALVLKDAKMRNGFVGGRWWHIVDRDSGEIILREDEV